MAQFPGSEASFTGFTPGHTLLADAHASQHNSEQAEITATQHKIGTGASTPTSGMLLRGNGVGSSAWGQAVLTSDVSGVLPQANGGTGTTLATGSGKAVYDTSPTISGAILSGQPTISDFTNLNHTHASAAQGGLLNGANAITDGTLTPAELVAGQPSTWVWQTWTPTVTADTVNPTLGTGSSTSGKYAQIGKTVNFVVFIKAGSAGTTTGTGTYYIDLPVAAKSDGFIGNNATYIIGTAYLYQAASGLLNLMSTVIDSTSRIKMAGHTNTGTGTAVTILAYMSSVSFQLAVNNQIMVYGTYEAT